MFEALFYITGALSVALIVALVQSHKSANRVETQKEALATEVAELRAKLKKEAQDNKMSLNALAEYNDHRVEREQEKITDLSLSHWEQESRVDELLKELERLEPGWALRNKWKK